MKKSKSGRAAPPKFAPLYGAAFGFNTDRRVKPVHFATGFFVSLFGAQYRTELLNNVVAFSDGKDLTGNYALDQLHTTLTDAAKIGPNIGKRELHAVRKHLRCLANNDEAVFPAYGSNKEFGCDYSTASADILTRTRDNDGFAGHFVHSVLDHTEKGREVLEHARVCMKEAQTPLRQIFAPLLGGDEIPDSVADRYTEKLGELEKKRIARIAKSMTKQTSALARLCANADKVMAQETKLRCMIIGLCIWLFRYLSMEAFPDSEEFILLADASGDASSRMRAQSRWSYARLREALVGSFSDFADAGRFDACEEAWEYVKNEMDGRPKFEEFYGTVALRSGLAQPRASRVPAKHFEPQPDTLRVLVLSVISHDEGLVPFTELLERLYTVWGIVFGGRPRDPDLLAKLGYAGLDQDHDLTPNCDALVTLLVELGLVTRFSDGLVMCHSQPYQS